MRVEKARRRGPEPRLARPSAKMRVVGGCRRRAQRRGVAPAKAAAAPERPLPALVFVVFSRPPAAASHARAGPRSRATPRGPRRRRRSDVRGPGAAAGDASSSRAWEAPCRAASFPPTRRFPNSTKVEAPEHHGFLVELEPGCLDGVEGCPLAIAAASLLQELLLFVRGRLRRLRLNSGVRPRRRRDVHFGPPRAAASRAARNARRRLPFDARAYARCRRVSPALESRCRRLASCAAASTHCRAL